MERFSANYCMNGLINDILKTFINCSNFGTSCCALVTIWKNLTEIANNNNKSFEKPVVDLGLVDVFKVMCGHHTEFPSS